VSLQFYDLAISGDLISGDDFDPAREVLVTIEKPQVEGIPLFFLQSFLRPYLAQRVLLPRLAVTDLAARRAFARARQAGPCFLTTFEVTSGKRTCSPLMTSSRMMFWS
jgi:hypothetical protein